jgi:spore germination protein KC
MKRCFIVLCLSIFLLLCGGCRDRNDIDQLAIVIGLGIDRVSKSDPILVTVQIVNPAATKSPATEGGGGSESPFITFTSQGKSVGEAIRNLARISPRQLFFSHNKVVVLGKAFAESDISEAMDYFSRNREFRRTSRVVVAEQTARQVLETKTNIEKLPSLGLDLMLTSRDQIYIYPIILNDFLLHLKSDFGISYAPLVALRDIDQEIKPLLQQGNEKQTANPDEKTKKIYLAEMVVFKNNRLTGILDESDSKSLMWLINKVIGDIIVIPYHSDQGEDNFTVDIYEGHSKITPHITDNDITMEIVCSGNAKLRQSGDLSPQQKDLEIYKTMERETEQILKSRLEKTIATAQKMNVDFIGFGRHIHNDNPSEWHRIRNDWDQRFPVIKYTVTCKITISKAGITKGSAISKDYED